MKHHQKTYQRSKCSWRFVGNADYDAGQVSLVRSQKPIVRLLSQRVAEFVGDAAYMPRGSSLGQFLLPVCLHPQ